MHILIIRPGAIGDTLLTLPVLQALRARYTHPHITLVGNAAVLPLACATGIVDDTSDYQTPQWSELFSSKGITTPSLQAQLQQIELAICWLHDSEGIVTSNLRRVGIPQVITAPGRPAPNERIHIMTYLAQTINITFETAGARLALAQTPTLAWTPTLARTLAIHPGSGGASKCWPVERFAALITKLWQRHIPVLLLAGPAEETRLGELERLLPSPPASSLWHRLINAPLLEVAQQLRSCRGYLGNDTGITHLAALLGGPTLALFGPSDPAIWHPQGPIVHILHTPILGNLSENVVMQRLESLCL